ncbi:hypothetical protein HS1genome_2278 [Sulfodiicoccus acidiphilus]|uniref:Transposase n=1 Tax=Sulfodiicoccus acidiphilus TaxID=1670455 RepID=A0A348B6T7_9CREN|nr:hypothetical protein [Sulfodiicoccus acidiphilus]BBD73889.1 hypothetical protein HS1genome_2278 [Sulfodiicoccus acidiphilus]GGT96075.1 hypothetical protein GCM10007116_11990 [Sulfodiicoccus acidiphilus]
MNRRNAWTEFKREVMKGEGKWIPRRLERVRKLIEQDPNVSMVKCAGILETDAVVLNRYIFSLMRLRVGPQPPKSTANILTPDQGTS